MKPAGTLLVTALATVSCIGCAGGNLIKREKGAGIHAVGGAAVGGALGLSAGALIGDQRQRQKIKQADQRRRTDANQGENLTTKA